MALFHAMNSELLFDNMYIMLTIICKDYNLIVLDGRTINLVDFV